MFSFIEFIPTEIQNIEIMLVTIKLIQLVLIDCIDFPLFNISEQNYTIINVKIKHNLLSIHVILAGTRNQSPNSYSILSSIRRRL